MTKVQVAVHVGIRERGHVLRSILCFEIQLLVARLGLEFVHSL